MGDLQNLDRLFEKIVENHKNSTDIDDDLKKEFLLELRKFENSSNVEKKFLDALTTQGDYDDEKITGTHESLRGSLKFKLFFDYFKRFRGGVETGFEYSRGPQPQATAANKPSKDESTQGSSKDDSKKM